MSVQVKRMRNDAVIIMCALYLIAVSAYIPNLEASALTFLCAAGLGIYGAVDFLKMSTGKPKSIVKDGSGVAWILAAAACSIAFAPFMYFLLGAPFDGLVTYFTGIYTFTGTTAFALAFVRAVFAYLLVFVLINTVIWAIVTSKAENKGGF